MLCRAPMIARQGRLRIGNARIDRLLRRLRPCVQFDRQSTQFFGRVVSGELPRIMRVDEAARSA
jgi:hypothetical protein